MGRKKIRGLILIVQQTLFDWACIPNQIPPSYTRCTEKILPMYREELNLLGHEYTKLQKYHQLNIKINRYNNPFKREEEKKNLYIIIILRKYEEVGALLSL